MLATRTNAHPLHRSERERGKEREREREKEIGMTSALAPFSYLVNIY